MIEKAILRIVHSRCPETSLLEYSAKSTIDPSCADNLAGVVAQHHEATSSMAVPVAGMQKVFNGLNLACQWVRQLPGRLHKRQNK